MQIWREVKTKNAPNSGASSAFSSDKGANQDARMLAGIGPNAEYLPTPPHSEICLAEALAGTSI